MKKIIIPFSILAISLGSCAETNSEETKTPEDKTVVETSNVSYSSVKSTINGSFEILNDELFAGSTIATTFSGVNGNTIKENLQSITIGLTVLDSIGNVTYTKDNININPFVQEESIKSFTGIYNIPEGISDGGNFTFVYTLKDLMGNSSVEFKKDYYISSNSTPSTSGVEINNTFGSDTLLSCKLFKGYHQFKESPIQVDSLTVLKFHLTGLTGFEGKDDLATVKYAHQLLNNSGEVLQEENGEFSGPTDAVNTTPLYATLNFTKITEENLIWLVQYSDVNSNKSITLKINIQKK